MTPAASTTELARRLDEITAALRDLRLELAHDFVRREVQDQRDARATDQIAQVSKGLTELAITVQNLTLQRDDERDERDRMRASDRRLILSLLVTAVISPIGTVVLTKALGS